MKTTKTNKNKNKPNSKGVLCAISQTYIAPAKARCANIKSNNTCYYSKEEESILQGTNTSPALTNILMTCVVLNATLINGERQLTRTNYKPEQTLYKVYFNNGVILNLNGNNAQVKKYFAQLTTYKQAIAKITFLNHANQEEAVEDYKHTYAPYERQKDLYKYGMSYNPDSKKTTIKVW